MAMSMTKKKKADRRTERISGRINGGKYKKLAQLKKITGDSKSDLIEQGLGLLFERMGV